MFCALRLLVLRVELIQLDRRRLTAKTPRCAHIEGWWHGTDRNSLTGCSAEPGASQENFGASDACQPRVANCYGFCHQYRRRSWRQCLWSAGRRRPDERLSEWTHTGWQQSPVGMGLFKRETATNSNDGPIPCGCEADVLWELLRPVGRYCPADATPSPMVQSQL